MAKTMRTHSKYKIINIGMLIVCLAVFVSFFGILIEKKLDEEPILTAKADNCYEETLHVITDSDYLPYSFYDEKGNMSGHDVEAVTLLANEMNMNLEITFASWEDAIRDMTEGKYDVLLTCDYFDDFEGSDRLLKTEPVSVDEFVVFSKSKYSSLDELYDKNIGIMENANVLPYIRMLGLEKECIEFSTNKDALRAVEEGSVDCAIVRYTVGAAILKELKYTNIESSLSIGNSYICFDVKEGDEETLRRMNSAIETLKTRGDFEKLRNKWLTTFIHKYTIGEMISDNLWVIPALGLIVVAIFFFAVRKEKKIIMEEAENSTRIMALEDKFESLYDVELSTGKYDHFIKGPAFGNIKEHMVNSNDFLGDTMKNMEVVYPMDREYVIDALQPDNMRRFLEEDTHYDCYYRLVDDGKTIWARMRVIYKDSTKRNVIIGVFNADDEMAAKVKAEEIRREQIARMIGGVSAYIVNPKTGKFVILSQDEHLAENYPEEEEYSTSITRYIENDVFEPDRKEAIEKLSLKAMNKYLESNEEYTYRFRDISKGMPRWYELHAVRLSENEILYGFTDKDTEVINRLIFDKLEEEYFALFYVNIDSRMVEIVKDEKGKAGQKGDVIGYDSFMLDLASDYEGETREYLEKNSDLEYVSKRFLNEDKATYMYKSRLEDGTKWCHITELVLARHEDGTPSILSMGFTLLDKEASENEELKLQLEEARDAAETASKTKTDFLFNMSHDIRTPMNAITGFTSMAKKYIGDETRVAEYLDKIDNSGKQLLSLINQVLEMARIESGKAELELQTVNVRNEFDGLMAVFTEQAAVNGLTFSYAFENVEHFHVLGDRARMSSITLNIIGNAMKYTPRGGKVNFIFREIAPRKEGYATYTLVAEDTGIGMSEEYLKVLFDPFTREKSSTVSKIQGTGLGMSIVKDIIDILGGTIEVKSEEGKGTRFDVTVDFKIVDDATAEAEICRKIDKSQFKGKRVLLVEDNELNREIAIDYLEEEGLSVEIAEDGLIAVQIMEKKGPYYYDFILMDIQMPVMDGFEATREIRKMYPEVKVPILALSANAFAEDRDASIAAGMDEHISKPIDIDELFGVLSKFV